MKCLKMLIALCIFCACSMQAEGDKCGCSKPKPVPQQKPQQAPRDAHCAKPAPAAPACGAQMPKASHKK